MTPENIAELKRLHAADATDPWEEFGDSGAVLRTQDDEWIDCCQPSKAKLVHALRNNAEELIGAAEQVAKLEAWKASVLNMIDNESIANVLRAYGSTCFQMAGRYDGAMSVEIQQELRETSQFVNEILDEAKEQAIGGK